MLKPMSYGRCWSLKHSYLVLSYRLPIVPGVNGGAVTLSVKWLIVRGMSQTVARERLGHASACHSSLRRGKLIHLHSICQPPRRHAAPGG